jgi:hypothetical protein
MAYMSPLKLQEAIRVASWKPTLFILVVFFINPTFHALHGHSRGWFFTSIRFWHCSFMFHKSKTGRNDPKDWHGHGEIYPITEIKGLLFTIFNI